jgi:thiamine monophosphate synthase
LFALGGVDESNAAACLAAGADGIAVVGAALAPNPLPLLSALQIQIA